MVKTCYVLTGGEDLLCVDRWGRHVVCWQVVKTYCALTGGENMLCVDM